MRIAFVLHDYNRVLGHSRYVTELAERFARDHDVHVFANTFAGVAPRITTHHVPALRVTALTTILSFYAAAAVRVGGQFDIVHAQGAAVPSPDVITAHISNARWLQGRQRLEGGRLSWRERLFAALVTPLERRALTSDRTLVVAVSKALADDIATVYGRRGETVVIHHGVDPKQFNIGVREVHRDAARAELELSSADVAHLFVGDLRKGFAQAIEALTTAPGRLLAVSRTDPHEMMRLAEARGLADRVRVLPPTDRIERYYAAADVFVLPTPYDAFGMVITEAMACGLPVVTSAAAGAAELIEPGLTGFVLSDSTDVAALASCMRTLALDADARRRIGTAAAAAMRKESWDTVADRTMALYERLKPAPGTVVPSPSS
jgi:UDP-glucose:(heptosyl)LPS alpha-1,3-glucosyltransferase